MAAGDHVEGGGTLVVKNRDWMPGDRTDMKLVRGNRGYSYFVLFGLSDPGNKGGINEAGLVVFSLSAPHGPARTDEAEQQKIAFENDWLLTQYANVDECLAGLKKGGWRLHPVHYVLADAHTVAYVEIGPDGRISLQKTDNGALWHANEYQDASMRDLNSMPSGGSPSAVAVQERQRLQLARQQMESQKQFTASQLLDFAKDPTVCYEMPMMRTYATFLVHQRPGKSTELVVRLYNPGEAPREARFSLEDALSGKALHLLR